MTIIFQVTYNCNLRCSYCYQPKTNHKVLAFDDAKVFINELFKFIKTKKSKIFEPWVTDYSTWVSDDFTLEFIGGEPFLYPELINNIVGYFYQSCINNLTLDIWERTTISINSNGTLYQTPAVKEFINRYSDKIVLGTSFEGVEECHNLERKTAGGIGSFNLVAKNVDTIREKYPKMQLPNKPTFVPKNIPLLPSVIKGLYKHGYKEIYFNTDIDNQLNKEDSEQYYLALCKAVDWIVDNNIDFSITPLNESFGKDKMFLSCGVNASRICLGPGGIISTCHMANESYTNIAPFGNVKDGFTNTKLLNEFANIFRNHLIPKQCKNCPISGVCQDCYVVNYKQFGDLNKAFIDCGANVARARAQLYWGKKLKEKANRSEQEQARLDFIEKTNKYDPSYQYLYLDDYKTEFVSDNLEEKLIEKEPE